MRGLITEEVKEIKSKWILQDMQRYKLYDTWYSKERISLGFYKDEDEYLTYTGQFGKRKTLFDTNKIILHIDVHKRFELITANGK